jgi:hypothetical protein
LIPFLHDFLASGSEPTSRLPQQGAFLLIWCLCGAAFAVPVLAFVSAVIGWVVYEFRKKRVSSEEAKSQATIIAVLSFVLLAGVLITYFFGDLYIP